ncbi:MAG: HAD family hydrolase [Planctomycetes bacterium]|nr:HAD family hydrolase [Planctomycetota bacterium]
MPKLILWDIDGTLVFFRGVGRRAAGGAFEEVFKIQSVAERTANVHFAGATDGRILREMAAFCKIASREYEERLELLKESYLSKLQLEIDRFAHDAVLPGAADAIALVSARTDCRQALLTGNYERGARIKLKPTGLDHHFKTGGFGDDHEDRRIVASVARRRSSEYHRIEVAPENVIVIGDTIHDVDCAVANGFRCIAVCTGHDTKESLAAAGAHAVLKDLTEFKDSLID